jgi:imidazolonepropionase-like amidohydrolase
MNGRALLPLLLAVLPACAPARPATLTAAPTLAITHISVIDATGAPTRTDQTVLIGDGRILRIGAAARVPVPSGTRTIDGTGKFLVPGLWDMHVHAWSRQPFESLFLNHGITGIREMGTGIDSQWGAAGIWEWRGAIRAGTAPGPRMVAAGFILNGGTPDQQPIHFFKGVPTLEAARSWVDSLASRGADFIKVYAALSPEAYSAIAQRAKERGLAFAGHVPARVGVRSASTAGQRSIEHLYDFLVSTSNEEDAVRRELGAVLDTSDSPGSVAQITETAMTDRLLATHSQSRADALFRLLAANGTWVTPTLTTTADPRCPGSPLPIPDSAFLTGVPRGIHRFVQLPDAPAETVAIECRRLEAFIRITGSLHRAGVRLLAGSDAPNPGIIPGTGLHAELELLVRAGLTPLEALQAATRNPAEYLNAGDRSGTVEVGKLADLVVLTANPLADIRNLRQIDAVIINGVVVREPGFRNP